MDISGTSLAELQGSGGGNMYQMPQMPAQQNSNMPQQSMQPNHPNAIYQDHQQPRSNIRYVDKPQRGNIDNRLSNVVSEINDDISDLDDDELDKLISKNYDVPENKSKKTKIPGIIRDPLTIVALYCILSLSVVKNNIAKYIPQIEPGDDGQPRLSGIIMYGIILAILFVIVKNYILP
jgi:hypothetical protein